jgi:phage-related holin
VLRPDTFSNVFSTITTDQWPLRVAISIGLALFHGFLQTLYEVYESLFSVSIDLVVLLFMALVIDLVTGILAAVRRGESVDSRSLERTGWKFLMYATSVMLAVGIGNASEGRFVEPVLQYLGTAVIFYFLLVELKSVRENWQAGSFIQGALTLLRDKELPETVTDDSDSSGK